MLLATMAVAVQEASKRLNPLALITKALYALQQAPLGQDADEARCDGVALDRAYA